jgi:hypothetical protein
VCVLTKFGIYWTNFNVTWHETNTTADNYYCHDYQEYISGGSNGTDNEHGKLNLFYDYIPLKIMHFYYLIV